MMTQFSTSLLNRIISIKKWYNDRWRDSLGYTSIASLFRQQDVRCHPFFVAMGNSNDTLVGTILQTTASSSPIFIVCDERGEEQASHEQEDTIATIIGHTLHNGWRS